MKQKRDTLTAQIDTTFRNVFLSEQTTSLDSDVTYSFTNITVTNAFSIKPSRSNSNIPSNVTTGPSVFSCYWRLPFTVAMSANFLLCDSHPSVGKSCYSVDAFPNITMTSAEFKKPWIQGNKQSGTMLWKKFDINLNLSKRRGYDSLSYFLRQHYENQMNSSVLSVLPQLRSNMLTVVDSWFDNNVIQHISTG